MKLSILLILFLVSHVMVNAQQDFYLFELKDISGRNVSLREYRGKKVLIVLSNASEPDTVRIKDIIKVVKKAGNNLVTIIIPVSDFGSASVDVSKEELAKYEKEGIIVTEKLNSKKTNSQQAMFLKWLTNKDKNSHFDMDVEVPFQMFVVSEKGRLYAVMAGQDDIAKGYLQDILAVNVQDK